MTGAVASGRLAVVGLGPGPHELLAPLAATELAAAAEVFGYGPYVDRVPERPGQRRIASDNREELDRAQAALARAAEGVHVAMVSGGDPGVFAMAAAVCEAVEQGPAAWRALDIAVIPGVTAMLAVAARIGAPLGHDFCAISLSDNLKPWAVIERRLVAAIGAGFVVALYNPASRARPHQLDAALDVGRAHLPAETPVIFGRAAFRPDERITTVPLREARGAMADMATLVLIGSPATRVVERPGLPPLVYSPRSAEPLA
ncbi:precorrin-3B C(17)-methyltransferase [Chelatococcus reniformis]|uniref:Precorrin-3B C(17)-methyltransferase n=1 Tax=Chelatococcus reniformis TaxID=1494448 RepID=A0A916UTG5_9HYPH|nr:precorrin-3B C(17)-methyltransferase [Chelatococcus reniformis]GGC86018.1 precorrin-3B C(17)-methyltransferase [Chelatococcus reniformis]